MKLQMKPHNLPGYLFVFCGLDGSGKTTQIGLLRDYMQEQGLSVQLTKQPTNAVRKSQIFRTYMDAPDHSAYDYRALSLLCASDRVQHTNKEIVPRLSSGAGVYKRSVDLRNCRLYSPAGYCVFYGRRCRHCCNACAQQRK